MPKTLTVDPSATRSPGRLEIAPIPIHAYAEPFGEARQRLGDATLVRVLRDMMVIREFETVLMSLKGQGAYRGIRYAYLGPAHLSIGQEGAAVGSALSLEPDDHVFGSHRSHGEFIAKGLSAVARLGQDALQAIMEGFDGGRLLRALEARRPGSDPVRRAEEFLLLGLLAEIFMKANGFNRGMGGSMHAFFPPFGIYPNNAIVGGSSGIATGAALFKKLRRTGGITVANIGDGSTGCGLVHESMNFAAMSQFDRLWDEDRRGGLPVLFLFHNNFYAMGGQTIGETAAWERLSRMGAGYNADNLHAETVDGTDPLAVADAVARKRALLVDGRGPALLDVECYRQSGHSPTDANSYRTREEMEAWRALDPIASFGDRLVAAGVLDAEAIPAMSAEVTGLMEAVMALAADPEVSPPIDVKADPLVVGRLMFSDAGPAPAAAAPLIDREASPRVAQLAKRSRHGVSPDGKKLSALSAITIRDALFEAVLDAFAADPTLVAYGEENRDWGGAFGVYRGLTEVLPYHRLFNSPISEAAIVSTAVGYAVEGGRALVELMYTDFLGRAGDEVFNQMAKWQAMSGGLLRMPVVLRASVGSKYGAQHSQDWSALAGHIPGLKVVYPATPYDAKGLLASALSGSDPVVFFESQRLYDTVELFHEGGVPADGYRVPIGVPDVKREGRDVTVLTIGPSLYRAVEAADILAAEHGLSLEIIDARTLVPFDYDPVIASVEKTGHLLVVTEANERGSFPMTLATNVQRHAFDSLKAPVRVLGAPNWIVPGADLEASYFPGAAAIVDVVVGEFMNRRPRQRTERDAEALRLARLGL